MKKSRHGKYYEYERLVLIHTHILDNTQPLNILKSINCIKLGTPIQYPKFDVIPKSSFFDVYHFMVKDDKLDRFSGLTQIGVSEVKKYFQSRIKVNSENYYHYNNNLELFDYESV